ncbi:hypothetical protein M569_03243 [Genlisea aurea]|uniref:Uncharacterized protein n=1 Tax=Genlisea aurea TaxID=192259 RepID=S8CX80_9LAMI|nr:hypothetical protein M569_03243 [Genlisea aurea]
MIYRRWSLLTGPAAILAGVVSTVIVADLLFIENDWLLKKEKPQTESAPSTK